LSTGVLTVVFFAAGRTPSTSSSSNFTRTQLMNHDGRYNPDRESNPPTDAE